MTRRQLFAALAGAPLAQRCADAAEIHADAVPTPPNWVSSAIKHFGDFCVEFSEIDHFVDCYSPYCCWRFHPSERVKTVSDGWYWAIFEMRFAWHMPHHEPNTETWWELAKITYDPPGSPGDFAILWRAESPPPELEPLQEATEREL
jgi:hypothetical protein